MSFISFTYDSYDSKTDQYIYTIVDSDFGSVEVGSEVGVGAGVAGRGRGRGRGRGVRGR